MYYVKTKREKIGTCNLCTKTHPLSWDHVPPKGSIELSTVEMENVFYILTGRKEGKKFRESQNGLKYRTICSDCNKFLGLHYDPVINDFAKRVGRYLKSNLTFPSTIHHRTKPVKLMRGILGHLLAAKNDFDKVILDQQFRDFIFDESIPIPNNIHIFYWIYPYDCTIILRDVVMPAVRGNFKKHGFFQVFKYFPIAYLVSNVSSYEGLHELTRFRDLQVDEEVEISIRLDRIEHHYWPELVDEDNILLTGQSAANSVSAIPKRIKDKNT